MLIEGLLAMALSGGAQERPDLVLDIRREVENGRPVYAGYVTSTRTDVLGYRLDVTCQSGTNRLTSSQSGEVSAPAGVRTLLSSLSCSSNASGEVRARLEVGDAPFEPGDQPRLRMERVFQEPGTD